MEPVRYRVRFPAPETHLFELEATFPADVFAGGDAVFWLPVWTPGSYLVREFARHVERVAAADAAGAKLACERLDKRSWRVGGAAGAPRRGGGRRRRARARLARRGGGGGAGPPPRAR